MYRFIMLCESDLARELAILKRFCYSYVYIRGNNNSMLMHEGGSVQEHAPLIQAHHYSQHAALRWRTIFRRCTPMTIEHGRSQDFGSGENTFGCRPLGGFEGAQPPEAGEFSTFLKNFLIKLLMNSFSIFFKKINKPCANFCAFRPKT